MVANKIIDIKVPDIGGADEVTVIELEVSAGQQIAVDDPLITLESDKATMDVPAPEAGTVKQVALKVGDKVSEGSVILQLEVAAAGVDTAQDSAPDPASEPAVDASAASSVGAATPSATPQRLVVTVPDIGGAEGVAIIEVLVKVGDQLAAEDPMLTLESDKATMDVPAPFAGEVVELSCTVGDKVSAGDQIAVMLSAEAKAQPASASATETAASTEATVAVSTDTIGNIVETGLDWDDDEVAIVEPDFYSAVNVYAGPAVRRLARELGVDLTLVKKPTGAKGRITKNDLKAYVKDRLQGGADAGLGVAAMPKVDFAKFGDIERVELSRIQKLSGSFLHRNWVSIPHVTQFADADITALEAFRQQKKKEALEQGIRLTPLAFIMKALEAAMSKFPKFNASLDPGGEHLILKKYCHIGVAVDTPNGLVVAVVRDVDQKGVYQLAKELGEISKKAREVGLSPADMQGGCMTISSLGGIGGSAFTPIVNAPEVAILGVSKSQQKPVYDAKKGHFAPHLMLPLCLSYDHRVIDGADGARFITYLSSCLSDLENLIL